MLPFRQDSPTPEGAGVPQHLARHFDLRRHVGAGTGRTASMLDDR